MNWTFNYKNQCSLRPLSDILTTLTQNPTGYIRYKKRPKTRSNQSIRRKNRTIRRFSQDLKPSKDGDIKLEVVKPRSGCSNEPSPYLSGNWFSRP